MLRWADTGMPQKSWAIAGPGGPVAWALPGQNSITTDLRYFRDIGNRQANVALGAYRRSSPNGPGFPRQTNAPHQKGDGYRSRRAIWAPLNAAATGSPANTRA
jgi:hypothetical protein